MERTSNKGYLTEKVVPPEVVYSRGSVASPSTLQGTFAVNGYDFHIDGWHTINSEGRLYVSLQAYTATRKSRKLDSATKKKFCGHMEEDADAAVDTSRQTKFDRDHPVKMKGVLNINGIEYSITGRAFITQFSRLSIEFLIFAPKGAQ